MSSIATEQYNFEVKFKQLLELVGEKDIDGVIEKIENLLEREKGLENIIWELKEKIEDLKKELEEN